MVDILCMNIGNYMNLINLLFEHWFPNFYLFLFYFYVKYLPSHDVNKLTGYLSYVLYRDSIPFQELLIMK